MCGAISGWFAQCLVPPITDTARTAPRWGKTVATMDQLTDVYEQIRRATLARQQVVATYKGHCRELCPHVLGTKGGRRQALFFQFGGGSSSFLPRGGEWRCIPVDGLEDVVVRDGPWHTDSGHHLPETC